MTIAAYPTYESYKDSLNDWLTEIPAHWYEKRLKHLGFLYAGLVGKAGEDFSKEQHEGFLPFVPFVSVANFSSVPPQFDYVRAKEDERQSRVRKGDIIFLMSSETEEDIARSALFDLDGIEPFLNSFCKGFRCDPSRIMPAFTNYLLMTKAYRDYFSTSARGFTRINLKQEYILNARILLPPLAEQRAISAFLDEKCAKIDEAVRIKEAQIALLRERRQILIQQAVTHGLNSDAPMKDSGIDWIGQIPAHWGVLRNFILFREMKVSGYADLPVLSVSIHSGVSSEELSDEENIRSIIKIEDRTAYKEVKPGDVAYNMMRAWQGGIGAVSVHGMVSPAYVVARPSSALAADYFELLYRCPAFIRQMDSSSKGITDFRKRLYWDDFKNLLTIVPPRDEQVAIIQNTTEVSKKIEDAISIKEYQITALKEYKTCLINAAVTGKIKVA